MFILTSSSRIKKLLILGFRLKIFITVLTEAEKTYPYFRVITKGQFFARINFFKYHMKRKCHFRSFKMIAIPELSTLFPRNFGKSNFKIFYSINKKFQINKFYYGVQKCWCKYWHWQPLTLGVKKKLRCITIKEKQTCRYGFTPHNAEQPLQGMELNEKEEKDENHILIRIRSRHLTWIRKCNQLSQFRLTSTKAVITILEKIFVDRFTFMHFSSPQVKQN